MIHKGDLIIEKGNNTDYSKLTEVTGYLSINSDAKLDNLTSVGGGLYQKATCFIVHTSRSWW